MIETTRKPTRLDYIDGLRAIACLSVLTLHAYVFAGMPEWRFPLFRLRPNPLRLVQFMNTGVHLFLILSGFCLFISFAKPDGQKKFKSVTFAKRRAWRILPTYYAAMVLSLMLLPFHQWLTQVTGMDFRPDAEAPSRISLLLHLALLHGLYAPANFQINGPFWTLGLEWQFYIAFPLLVWLFHRVGGNQALVILLAITIAYRAVCHHFLRSSAIMLQWDVISSNLPGRIAEFGMGMLAAWNISRTGESNPSASRLLILLAIALVFAIAGILTSPFSTFNDALWGACYFMVLNAALAGPSALRSVLSWRPLVYVGTISYSVYLIHLPVLDLLRRLIVVESQPIRSFALLASIGGLVAVAVSAVFFAFFERPFLRGRPDWRVAASAPVLTAPVAVPAADTAP